MSHNNLEEQSDYAGCSISVVIPTYNYGHYLPDAVRSVMAQEGAWDLTIIDDGSTDGTAEVVRALVEEIPGKFNYIYQENSGLAATRNRAVSLTSGDYFLFLDADDWLCDGALEKINIFLRRANGPAMVICDYYSVDMGSTRLRRNRRLPESPEQRLAGFLFKKSFSIASGATLIRRDVLQDLSFPESLSSSEDLPFYAGVLVNYRDVELLREPVVNIRKHPGRMRLDIQRMEQAAPLLNDEILKRLPARYEAWRRRFELRHLLSMSRLNFMAGNKAQAKKYYWAAVKIDPRALLKFSYLKKMLKNII